MKKTFVSLAALGLALAATGAIAATDDFPTTDSDKNGSISWTEFGLVFPDVTEEQFRAADADGNGELSLEEFGTLAGTTGSITPPPAAVDQGPQPMPGTLTYNPADDG